MEDSKDILNLMFPSCYLLERIHFLFACEEMVGKKIKENLSNFLSAVFHS